jgi:hypothetical protein
MRELSQRLSSGYHFGLENSRIADRLENLAKGIRDGSVLPQHVERAIINPQDDFQTERMTIEFAEQVLRDAIGRTVLVHSLSKKSREPPSAADQESTLLKECGGKWFKVHGSAFQESGQPDIIGCVDGLFFGFEVKVPLTGKPSELQLETLHEWREQAAVACIVESPAQAVSLVKAATASPEKRRRGDTQYRWICRTLRAAHGQDLGYGRSPNNRKRPVKRRSARWAVDQFRKHLGQVPKKAPPVVLGAP